MRIYLVTEAEKTELAKTESRKGGGWQGAMYELRFCVKPDGDKLRCYVSPDLYQRLKGYVEQQGTSGGWQGRIPARMMEDITGRPAETIPDQGSLL